MRKRKDHKLAWIRGWTMGRVQCRVWKNYYWIRGKNEEINGWGEQVSHALSILQNKPLLFISPLSNQDNNKQEAATPVGEQQEDAKKPPQITDLDE